MTNLPTPYAAARIAAFLNDHLSWSAYWDKRYGLWRVAEDDTDSDLYAESQDADVVIGYMRTHVRDTRSRRGVMTPVTVTLDTVEDTLPQAGRYGSRRVPRRPT